MSDASQAQRDGLAALFRPRSRGALRALGDGAIWLIEKLALPVALGLLTYMYSHIEAERTNSESRYKLYSELLSKREEADASVRIQVFSTLLGKYLEPGQSDLAQRLVVMQLLSSNFDDTLNLSPLFWQLDADILRQPPARQPALRKALDRAVESVKNRQLDNLGIRALFAETDVPLELPDFGQPQIDVDLVSDAQDPADGLAGCHFTVHVLEHEPDLRRILVSVQTDRLGQKPAAAGEAPSNCVEDRGQGQGLQARMWTFWVDQYDVPLLAFTRVSANERFAVVLTGYKPDMGVAKLRLLYFDSARSGPRDKPLLDDALNKLGARSARVAWP